MYQGNGHRDAIHRVYKVKVTEDVRTWSDNSQLREKRGGDSCPTSYSLCEAALGGDCCPDNYACAQDSCYATTAAVSTCQGRVGAYACALSLGGGCCPQGYLCGQGAACLPPAGATYSTSCPTGSYSCAASVNGGCCANGMGCAISSCFSLTPVTTTLTYTTTEDGSTVTITTTSTNTPTPTDLSTATGGDAVAKFYPDTVSKTEATAAGGSSSGGGSKGGISKGAIGGIVAAAAIILIAVLAAAFFIIKRLKHTEQVVQTHRETTSGTRTRQTTEKKNSEVNVRVIPTPSEVDAFDYDPLMMNSSIASPLRPGQRPPAPRNRHVRADSDAGTSPSLWSGQSATRWNTPSVNSDPEDSGRTTYFELPPRTAHPDGRPVMRQSMNSNDSSAYSYHNFTYAHGRHTSNASELSAGSDDNGSQHGVGSPLMPIELGVDGAFRPELPGSDTETERRSPPRRKGTAGSINDIVSPMSMRPGAAQPGRARRRGDSQIVSPLDGQIAGVGGAASVLGSIDESASVTASRSLHGHYGPDIGGRESDVSPVPGFVPLERSSQDASERHS